MLAIPYRRLPASIGLGALGAGLIALPSADHDPIILGVVGFCHALGFGCWALAGAHVLGGSLANRLGLDAPRTFGVAHGAIAIIGCLLLSQIVVLAVAAWLGPTDAPLAVRVAARTTPVQWSFLLVGAALAPAVGEELFFRGALLRGIERGFPAAVAIAISALAFALFHPGIERAMAAAVLGVYLGCVSRTRGGVPLAIACHAINNVVALFSAR